LANRDLKAEIGKRSSARTPDDELFSAGANASDSTAQAGRLKLAVSGPMFRFLCGHSRFTIMAASMDTDDLLTMLTSISP